VQNQASQSQVQNQISIANHNQGKHINKGRWTKEEVRTIAIYEKSISYIFLLN